MNSYIDSERVPSIPVLIRYFGLFLFLLSFLLPAISGLKGWECAIMSVFAFPGAHDDQISSLAGFGGWVNPEVVLLFFLSRSRRKPELRSLLTVLILFSIPMTWIAIHRMYRAGMTMEPLQVGHFLWVIGIVLIVVPDLVPAFRFVDARWVAVAGVIVIAVLAAPIFIGFTMRAPTKTDDFHYDLAWSAQDPGECGKIDPNAVGRSDQWDNAWGFADYTYMQSDCYRNVAVMLHDPQLCDHVKSGSIDRLFRSVVAKSECRNQRWTTGTAFGGTRSSPFPFQE